MLSVFAIFPVEIAFGNTTVSPNKVSLPSGPGSIEGLGESFELRLNTGTVVFRILFKLTRLRGFVVPDMGLTCHCGGGPFAGNFGAICAGTTGGSSSQDTAGPNVAQNASQAHSVTQPTLILNCVIKL